jgi:hypothetical protein
VRVLDELLYQVDLCDIYGILLVLADLENAVFYFHDQEGLSYNGETPPTLLESFATLELEQPSKLYSALTKQIVSQDALFYSALR